MALGRYQTGITTAILEIMETQGKNKGLMINHKRQQLQISVDRHIVIRTGPCELRDIHTSRVGCDSTIRNF